MIATQGTQAALESAGIACRRALKVREGRPHIVDMIKNDEIDLIVNTTEGKRAIRESHSIRREAELRRVTYYTTVAAAHATCDALDHLEDHDVNRLQDLHRELGSSDLPGNGRDRVQYSSQTRREERNVSSDT
jgi:carbamoyl-phosphate synthase large subunit